MKKILFLIFVFLLSTANAQIIRDEYKQVKEQIIFVDTITIENPIIIMQEHTKIYWLYFVIRKKYKTSSYYFSSEAYLDRLLDQKFTEDSLLNSDITYLYWNVMHVYFRNHLDRKLEKDIFYSTIIEILKKDYSFYKVGIKFSWDRDYIKTEKKGFYYSRLKTNKFALFLVRSDYRCDECDIGKYHRVAVPIELNEDEPAWGGGPGAL